MGSFQQRCRVFLTGPLPRRANAVATGHTYLRKVCELVVVGVRCAQQRRDLSCFAFVDAAANYGQVLGGYRQILAQWAIP